MDLYTDVILNEIRTVESLMMSESQAPSYIHSASLKTKAGYRFKRGDVRILHSWYNTHRSYPYPTSQDITFLQEQTDLDNEQIRNWFGNKRRKEKATSSTPAAINQHTQLDNTTLPIAIDGANGMDSFTPFDRWRASPPENDPVDLSALMEAATSATINPAFVDEVQSDFSSFSDMSTSMFQMPSLPSSWGSWSGSDASFAASYDSTPPSDGARKQNSRRKRKLNKAMAPKLSKKKQVHCYQCTFCTATFKTKYDWQRHEKSIHLTLESWVCSLTPINSTYLHADTLISCCHCDILEPSTIHIASHDFSNCADEIIAKRTFKRKDHLVQHLKLMHNSKFSPEMTDWKISLGENLASTCGLCFAKLKSWDDRVEHIAGHYRNGIGMECWVGTWGFEPHIAAMVEHVMPPYLIHYERGTMDPFIALDKYAREHSAVEYCGDGSSIMEITLASQIREQISRGLPFPSDAEVASMARIIVFGVTDPWDATFADSPEWLIGFKQRLGFAEYFDKR